MSEDYAFGRGYAQSFTVGGNTYLGTPLPKLPAGAVKKKTLEFENLVITYDYELRELTINQKGVNVIVLPVTELTELTSALKALALAAEGSGTELR